MIISLIRYQNQNEFIINQIVRSPGIYFETTLETSNTEIKTITIIPSKGSWLTIKTDLRFEVNN